MLLSQLRLNTLAANSIEHCREAGAVEVSVLQDQKKEGPEGPSKALLPAYRPTALDAFCDRAASHRAANQLGFADATWRPKTASVVALLNLNDLGLLRKCVVRRERCCLRSIPAQAGLCGQGECRETDVTESH